MHLKLKSPVGLSNKRIFSSLGVTLHIESTASNRKKNRARELYTRGDPCRIINVRTYLFKEIRSTTIVGGPLVSLQGRAHRHMYHYIYTQAHYSGLRSSPSYYTCGRAPHSLSALPGLLLGLLPQTPWHSLRSCRKAAEQPHQSLQALPRGFSPAP